MDDIVGRQLELREGRAVRDIQLDILGRILDIEIALLDVADDDLVAARQQRARQMPSKESIATENDMLHRLNFSSDTVGLTTGSGPIAH